MAYRRLFAVIVVVGLITLAGAAIAYTLVESRPAVVSAAPPDCAPPPCAAPNGFEVDVTNVTVEGSLLKLDVGFRNHTTPGLEAVSSRHTAPADFHVQLPDGSRIPPTFSGPGCAEWAELHIDRGASSESKPLCFASGGTPLRDLMLAWDPDLGLIPQPVAIPLGR